MKKVIGILLVVGLAALAIAGCQSASSNSSNTTNTLSGSDAKDYSEMGVNLAKDITGWMGTCAQTGGVTPLSVKGLHATTVASEDVIVTDEGNGLFHVTGITTDSSTGIDSTYWINMHSKITKVNGKATGVDIYGGYGLDINASGSILSYSQSYGSVNNPFHADTTWDAAGTNLTQIAVAGSMSYTISAGSAAQGTHTIDMAFTFSNYNVGVAAGYPNGLIAIAASYDGSAQSSMTITFNGTSTASFVYGTAAATYFTISPIVIS